MGHVLKEKAAEGVAVLFSSHQLELVERLCDRVGIIRNGQIVADGTVDELTSSGSITLHVRAPYARPGWAEGIPGTRVIADGTAATVIELYPGTDDQTVLHAALATGPVTEFSRHRPTLAELFRTVVAEETPS
jgi:ABC-2 type transport system ATP-binding protein